MFEASTEKNSDNKRGRAKSIDDSNSQKHKKRNIETSQKNNNGNSDSDLSVKKLIPNKNCKRHILDSDLDDEDPSYGISNKNLQCMMAEGGTLWLQDKNRIVLEMNGIHWHDHFIMDSFF